MKPGALQIRQSIFDLLNVNISQIGSRKRDIVEAKTLIAVICRDKYHMTYYELAKLLHLRNHATVIHHISKHDDLIQFDKSYRDTYYHCVNHIDAEMSRGNKTDYHRLYNARKSAIDLYDSTVGEQEAMQLSLIDSIERLNREVTALKVLTDNLNKRCEELTTLMTSSASEL